MSVTSTGAFLVCVDQGCPSGACLFFVAMWKRAEQVLQHARSQKASAAFYMYLNDCYVVASPEASENICSGGR